MNERGRERYRNETCAGHNKEFIIKPNKSEKCKDKEDYVSRRQRAVGGVAPAFPRSRAIMLQMGMMNLYEIGRNSPGKFGSNKQEANCIQIYVVGRFF